MSSLELKKYIDSVTTQTLKKLRDRNQMPMYITYVGCICISILKIDMDLFL